MDIVERLITYRDRPGRSREGRDLLADACNEIDRLRTLVHAHSDVIERINSHVGREESNGEATEKVSEVSSGKAPGGAGQ
jgi:hypothetical protein